MNNLKVILDFDGFIFSEKIRIDEEIEYYKESNLNAKGITFDQFYSHLNKISSEDLDKYNGNHFIFGYIEALMQSDDCPYFFTKGNNFLITVEEDKDFIDRIFIIHTLSIIDGKLEKDRIWGYYFDYDYAEKVVLQNMTDIFEMGYYNYALISELKPGIGLIPENAQEQIWFKAEYENEDIKIEDNPKVTLCENPIPSYVFSF